MRSFDRWRALGRDEKRLVLGAALAVGVAAAGLRVAGVRRMLRAAAPKIGGRALTPPEIRTRVNAIDRAGRYVPGGTCLAKSLALAWMLRRNGVAAMVRIGVRTGGRFDAHAWVECEGTPIGDAPDGYTAFVDAASDPKRAHG
jgi:hypothetical protein